LFRQHLKIRYDIFQGKGIPENNGILDRGQKPEDLFLIRDRFLLDQISKCLNIAGELVPVLPVGSVPDNKSA
jgi:hypothetical protein